MLQSTSSVRESAWPGWVQGLVVMVLTIASLCVAVLRGPAQSTPNRADSSVAGQPRQAAEKSSATTAPFNLAYIPTGSHGFYGIRPAEFFRRPDSKRLKDALNSNLKEGITFLFVLLILAVRPTGLMGRKEIEKV